jgi:hypothetical protein
MLALFSLLLALCSISVLVRGDIVSLDELREQKSKTCFRECQAASNSAECTRKCGEQVYHQAGTAALTIPFSYPLF